jgi:hypothetical protein
LNRSGSAVLTVVNASVGLNYGLVRGAAMRFGTRPLGEAEDYVASRRNEERRCAQPLRHWIFQGTNGRIYPLPRDPRISATQALSIDDEACGRFIARAYEHAIGLIADMTPIGVSGRRRVYSVGVLMS